MAIIDFELGRGNQVPDDYHGFHWDNFGLQDHQHPGNGYANVLTSGTDVAFNRYAAPASFSADRDFDFRDGYFAAAWDTDLRVKFIGYDDGVKVAVHTVILDQSKTYVAFDSSFESIDRVQIVTKGGVDTNPNDGQGAHVAMDDLEVHFETPPPAAHADFVT